MHQQRGLQLYDSAHAESNAQCQYHSERDADANTDADPDVHGHAHANSEQHGNFYGDSYANTDANFHTNTDSDTYQYTDADSHHNANCSTNAFSYRAGCTGLFSSKQRVQSFDWMQFLRQSCLHMRLLKHGWHRLLRRKSLPWTYMHFSF